MLLCKCSSGHVEGSIDNIARNFAAKTQVFLVKVQKRRKNKCSRVFFSTLFLCTLRFMFRHTWLFFCQKQKKLTRSPKKDDTSINYFHHFFSKFCWGHVKCIFSNLPYFFFAKRWLLSLRNRKGPNNYSSLRKKPQNVPLHP